MGTVYCRQFITWGTLCTWSIRTAFTVLETAVGSTFGEIWWKNVPFVTLSTITFDHVVTSLNGRRFTFSIRFIDCIPFNTITAILVIIEAFCTIWNVALFASLHSCERFVINIPPSLTFEACMFLHTSIAVSYRTVSCFWSCCMNFLPNTTVLNRVSRNVCVSINSPFSPPWILYNPIFLCIPN